MFKKTIAMILVAIIVAAIPFTSQAGVLPSMADMTIAIQEEKAQNGAIDFGMRMNREPSTVYQNADGSTAKVYSGVTTEDYEAFSIILGDTGYQTTSYEMLETKDGYRIFLHSAESGLDITMEYIFTGSSAQTLSMIYPTGVAVEQEIAQPNPFAGYIEVTSGFQINVPGGVLEIKEVGGYFPESGKSINYSVLAPTKYYDQFTTGQKTTDNPWITATITNRKQQQMDCSQTMSNIAFHYVNADDDYVYNLTSCCNYESGFLKYDGMPSPTASTWRGKICAYKKDFSMYPCTQPSMTTGTIGAFIDGTIPSLVKEATDGILAITFKVNDVDYVYYIRH